MVELKTQPYEGLCAFTEHEHILDLPECCPVSHNPRPGSTVTICYKSGANGNGYLEVYSLRAFIDSYVGGRGEVRSMEGMLEEISQECSDVLGKDVTLKANLLIEPSQVMNITCYAFPKSIVNYSTKTPK